MSDKEEIKTHYEPDYTQKCEICEQTPVVRIVDDSANVTHDFEMCGPCVFGEAACIDPSEW